MICSNLTGKQRQSFLWDSVRAGYLLDFFLAFLGFSLDALNMLLQDTTRLCNLRRRRPRLGLVGPAECAECAYLIPSPMHARLKGFPDYIFTHLQCASYCSGDKSLCC